MGTPSSPRNHDELPAPGTAERHGPEGRLAMRDRVAAAMWLGLHAALIAVALRIYTIVLLQLHLDTPATTLGWLALASALVLLVRWGARWRGSTSLGLLSRLWNGVDGTGLIFIGLFLWLLLIFHQGYIEARSDAVDYFAQVRSLVFDFDLDFANEYEILRQVGRSEVQPFGSALLWSPFFLFAHAWLSLLSSYGWEIRLTGLSNPYQQAIGMGTLVYGVVGLVLVYRVVREYFSKRLALAATLATLFGSFLVWYFTVEATMSQGNGFFTATLFLYCWHRTRGRRGVAQWGLLGAAGGLMAMVRWESLLFFVVPGIEVALEWLRAIRGRDARRHTSGEVTRGEASNRGAGAADSRGTGAEGNRGAGVERSVGGAAGATSVPGTAGSLLARHGTFAIAALLAFTPQFLFWSTARGSWRGLPTDQYQLEWNESAHVLSSIVAVLFSPRHGLFSWTPLLYLSMLGLIVFYRKDRLLTGVLLAAFGAQLYMNAVVGGFGVSFGARRFASFGLGFCLGLAGLLDWLRRRPLLAPTVVVLALVTLNVFFMLDFQAGEMRKDYPIPYDRIFESAYSRIGNPFSFPASLLFALRYGTSPAAYDHLEGLYVRDLEIDVGSAPDESFLLDGWAPSEAGPGFRFRWATGEESSLIAPLARRFDYVLEARGQPFNYEGAPPQIVEVEVNGRSAGRFAMEPEIGTYRVPVPRESLRFKFNVITFRYRRATSPRSLGISADTRPLAAWFDHIAFYRR